MLKSGATALAMRKDEGIVVATAKGAICPFSFDFQVRSVSKCCETESVRRQGQLFDDAGFVSYTTGLELRQSLEDVSYGLGGPASLDCGAGWQHQGPGVGCWLQHGGDG